MGGKKQYDGYRHYQYLKPGVDYVEFEFHKDPTRWFEPYIVPVSAAEEERVQAILRNNIVVSVHDHPMQIPKNPDEMMEVNHQGREFVAYDAISRSHIDCLWDNFMDGTASITSKMGWKWEDALFDLGMRLCDTAHQTTLIRCEGLKDVKRAFAEGRIALVPCLESATPIENEVDRLDVLYGFGVRSVGLVYSESNALGSGLREARDGGLTAFGRQAVERMNKLGIIIDTAHVGDQTTLDAIEVSEHPVVITHSGARALCDTRRMKPDNVLEAVARKGGFIGIESAPHTTLVKGSERHTIDEVMQHLEYCVKLMGIDHVAIGPDTLYGDHNALHRVYGRHLSIAAITGQEVPKGGPPHAVAGMENPTECMPNVVRWLVSHGYKDADIARIIGGNAMRVMKKVWGE